MHPFNDEAVIAGQGTVALEILEDLPEVDVVLVPVGGGGLVSGIATGDPGAAGRGARHRGRAGGLARRCTRASLPAPRCR